MDIFELICTVILIPLILEQMTNLKSNVKEEGSQDNIRREVEIDP